MHANANLQGVAFLIAGMWILSLQNIAVKSIDDGYAVLQIVVVRSIIAIPCTYLLYRYYEGNRGFPQTQQPKLQFWRGFLLFVAYTTYFMGLAALPLADVAALRFSSPLFLTIFSVLLLGEVVGVRRWTALIVGFVGVLFIVQPGTAAFTLGRIFVLITSVTYALSSILTRWLRTTDSSATMAFYSTLVYLGSALILSPIVVQFGDASTVDPSIAFLVRAWAWPTMGDLLIMIALGFIWSLGMFCVAKAYSLALASVAAPFEYLTLPINVMWGYLLWHEVPDATIWIGALLTISSGLYILYRERIRRADPQ